MQRQRHLLHAARAPPCRTSNGNMEHTIEVALLRDAQYERPPYAISNGNSELGLGTNTIGMTAHHEDGALEYDAHNLYGLSEAAATAHAVAEVTGKRPFILSRWAAVLTPLRCEHVPRGPHAARCTLQPLHPAMYSSRLAL